MTNVSIAGVLAAWPEDGRITSRGMPAIAHPKAAVPQSGDGRPGEGRIRRRVTIRHKTTGCAPAVA